MCGSARRRVTGRPGDCRRPGSRGRLRRAGCGQHAGCPACAPTGACACNRTCTRTCARTPACSRACSERRVGAATRCSHRRYCSRRRGRCRRGWRSRGVRQCSSNSVPSRLCQHRRATQAHHGSRSQRTRLGKNKRCDAPRRQHRRVNHIAKDDGASSVARAVSVTVPTKIGAGRRQVQHAARVKRHCKGSGQSVAAALLRWCGAASKLSRRDCGPGDCSWG